MSLFGDALRRGAVSSAGRRWLFVPYDQLSDDLGPLARESPSTLGVVLVECPNKAERRPYHKQKLALVLTSLRHFALEQVSRGVAVRHVVGESYAAVLQPLAAELGAMRVMRPAERELRHELAPLFRSGVLEEIEHEGWLTAREELDAIEKHQRWRMDDFYRAVRRKHGWLMNRGKPVGDRFSFDAENRRAWRGPPRDPAAPVPPTFHVDEITREVCDLVSTRMKHHPGVLEPERIAASREDVDRSWAWARENCLEHFGPFEDAMSTRSRTLFHTQISPLLNLSRLTAKRVVDDVLQLDALPLASLEGFLRQVVGWREYMHHVHEATDGFRNIFGAEQPVAEGPGDGGYRLWRGETWPAGEGGDGGSQASILGASRPVPPAYWGAKSGLNCVDQVVASVWEDGYSHHITRLMVLSNVAMLLDVSPRELSDWFWVAYVDAYDWVVETNVHGMGTFGVGDLLTTKPYVAGAAYINKMSDFCGGCGFNPKKNCPLTPMYWAYLSRHREVLSRVDRMTLVMKSEARRTPEQQAHAASIFERVSALLSRAEELDPTAAGW